MIYDYEIKKQNQEEVLYLYLDLNSEFAKVNAKGKKKKLKEEIEDFIQKNKIDFKGKKVVLLVGGFVVGTLLLGSTHFKVQQSFAQPENVAVTPLITLPFFNFQEEDNIDGDEQIEIEESIIEEMETEESEKNNVEDTKSNYSSSSTTQKTQSAQSSQSGSNNSQTNQEKTVQESQIAKEVETVKEVEAPKESEPEQEITDNKTYVTIVRSNGTVLNIEFEEYIIGVVGAEMPASFHAEALKAQAVLARTYALKTLERNGVLTDSSSTQNYKTNSELKSLWGSSYNTYYNKIKSAVESTKGIYLTYHGEIIDAVYHSTSNGMTEDSKNVWGNSIPYLVSVESPYDSSNSSFQVSVSFTYEDLTNKFGFIITADTNFNILSFTSGNRVENIEIDGNIYTGIQVRTLLGLRSADFTITKTDSNVTFVTKGYGHGVGMSQYGANGMAKNGSTYSQILKHYYSGVTLSQK